MVADWKQWEGRVVNGEFPLQRFLGGSEHHAVFLVDKSAGGRSQTAIRFRDPNFDDARDQLQLWEGASQLAHPNLLRIFETGRCAINGGDFVYAWMECGEEDLSQILPTRMLTPAEMQQMLESVLSALSYLHAHGLVHGSLKPSNILAVGDAVKISSDTLRPFGAASVRRKANSAYDAPEVAQGVAPSADVWSLGVTLAEAMTQRLPVLDPKQQAQPTLPNGIPQPFHEIIENCLQLDPARRWTVAQIATRLHGAQSEAALRAPAELSSPIAEASASPQVDRSRKQSARWLYLLALAGAVVIAVVLIAPPKPRRTSSEAQPTAAPSESTPAPAKPSAAVTEPAGRGPGKAQSASPPSEGTGSGRGTEDQTRPGGTPSEVLQRVEPRVSPNARRTITGMIRVLVRVNVDAEGSVTEAQLQSAGPSKYFARIALEAARDWKFRPAISNGRPVASQWTLRFGFSRRNTETAAQRTAP